MATRLNQSHSSRIREWTFSLVANNVDHVPDTDSRGIRPVMSSTPQNDGDDIPVLTGENKQCIVNLRSTVEVANESSSTSDEEKVDVLSPPSSSSSSSIDDQTPFLQDSTDYGDMNNNRGWTFSGPNWTLKSNVLLKLTYRPSWQALPEFTNMNAANDVCRRFACTSRKRSVEFLTDVYTTQDVSNIEYLSNKIEIRGIGPCRAIRIFLRNQNHHSAILENIPVHMKSKLQHQWNVQQQNQQHEQKEQDSAQFNRFTKNEDSLPLPPWEIQQGRDSRENGNDHVNLEEYIGNDQKYGPILLFAMPLDMDDSDYGTPLLWKVQFPPNPLIAMETWTVLDSSLTNVNPSDRNNNKEKHPAARNAQDQHHVPTHIYLNGYQSWSFAGSVAKGEPQPTSALPNVLSKAFNHGGKPPPHGSQAYNYEQASKDGIDSYGGNQIPIPKTRTTSSSGTTTAGTVQTSSSTTTTGAASTSSSASYFSSSYWRSSRNETTTKTAMKRKKKKHGGYCSDFFTCITSDGGNAYRSPAHFLANQEDHNQEGFEQEGRSLDEWGGPALVVGWLSQHSQFGVVSVNADLNRIAMHASSQGQMLTTTKSTDWAYAQLITPHCYDEEPMVHYLHAVAAYNEAKPLQNGSLLTGWCSWYHYYEDISAENLRDNFENLKELRTKIPTNVAVVDDGYMTAWGDWDSLKPKKFPVEEGGLRGVADNIRDNGMRPGLWLAPFTCDKKSKLLKDHPDWVIRNDEGRTANSSNCGKFFYGLDATNPEVRAYVYKIVQRAVKDWGFDVLKIDFLYAACLAGNGKYDLSISRAEAMHLALSTIRAAAGPTTFLIGCGCPIGTAVGYVDGMRVSADTGPTWYPAFPFPYWDHGTLPCLRSMIRNSMSRAPLGHRWWHNDPDCLLLGESTKLNDIEVASAASIVAMTCGMLLLSDDLTKVSIGRMRILSKIYPMTGATAIVLDLHSSNDGLPSLLRLWCTDRYELAPYMDDSVQDHNAESTFFGRMASFALDKPQVNLAARRRNCIHIAKGLGTWTLLSLSNWLDKPAVVYAPIQALQPPPKTGWEDGDDNDNDYFVTKEAKEEDGGDDNGQIGEGKFGYHIFAFWSSKYAWIPEQEYSEGASSAQPQSCFLSKRLLPHETEIFHVKPVSTNNLLQYIGSDIHFSCGYEVQSFTASLEGATICLKNNVNRVGSIFVYVPHSIVDGMIVKVGGVPIQRKYGGWDVVANTPGEKEDKVTDSSTGRKRTTVSSICRGRIVQIWVVVHGNNSERDGEISIILP